MSVSSSGVLEDGFQNFIFPAWLSPQWYQSQREIWTFFLIYTWHTPNHGFYCTLNLWPHTRGRSASSSTSHHQQLGRFDHNRCPPPPSSSRHPLALCDTSDPTTPVPSPWLSRPTGVWTAVGFAARAVTSWPFYQREDAASRWWWMASFGVGVVEDQQRGNICMQITESVCWLLTRIALMCRVVRTGRQSTFGSGNSEKTRERGTPPR